MYNNGAVYSAMSGTGSTVFGIFNKEKVPLLKFPAHYFCQVV
jgi:4-diphosphocytidyl-2-C-methyl-D-erythritol kinase